MNRDWSIPMRRGEHFARDPRMRGVLVVSLGALCLLSAGCGHSGPAMVCVEGKVTYGGGPWPKSGMIYFAPKEAASGLPLRPARAEFDANGEFRVTSFRPGDGLVPGRYGAAVECWKVPPSMGSSVPSESYVPAKYQLPATSGLELNIHPGQGDVRLQWDIPKP